MNPQRDDFIDFTKAVAILLVVLGHSVQYGNGATYLETGNFFDNQLFRWIYGVHMPLFMIISGHLSKRAIAFKSTAELLKEKSRTLLIPVVAWGTVEFAIELTAGGAVNAGGAAHLAKRLVWHIVYGLWFLWAVFYCTIAVSVIYKRLRNSLFAYAALIVAMFLTPDIYNFHTYKFMFLYFALPVAFAKVDARQWLARRTNVQLAIMAATSLAAYGSIMSVWDRDFYIYTTGFSSLGKHAPTQVVIDVTRWTAGLVGIAAALSLLQLITNIIPRATENQLFRTMGRQSLGIYILSGLMFSYPVQLWTQDRSYSITATLAICVVVALASLALSHLISKFPLLNLTLFGRRSS
jgi:fucose 4-O-acetylase-like acetyltransferase